MATLDEWMQKKTGDSRHVERANLTKILNPSPWVVACPACRGYSLERRWCGRCGGDGVIKGESR